jgi:transposase
MKNAMEKELDALVPLPLVHSIHDGLRSYEGTRLGKPRSCPHCGQTDYHKHDTRPRTFAVLVIEDSFEEVTVLVQRYWCKRCEQPVDNNISGLFYEDCLYGKPITLAMTYVRSDEKQADAVEDTLDCVEAYPFEIELLLADSGFYNERVIRHSQEIAVTVVPLAEKSDRLQEKLETHKSYMTTYWMYKDSERELEWSAKELTT